MDYETIEDAIVERLQMPNVDVGPLPYVGVLNEPRATSKPQLFVIANVTNFGERENTAVVAQLGTVQCEIFIRAKNRRGELGIFDLYSKIGKRLLGFRLPGAKTAITFNEFGYVFGATNNWHYSLTFSFDAYNVAIMEEEPYQEITDINFNINGK